MPVPTSSPQPIQKAVFDMEAAVASFKSSLAFAAPEAQDLHYARLQERLADVIYDLYEASSADENEEQA